MLSWRGRKQFVIIILISLPFIIGGIWVVEKIIPDPSCFDGKQNQEEFGVDCGGPCMHCALKYPKSVKVFWARGAAGSDKRYDVVAEIENLNELLSSAEVTYEIMLSDKFGQVAKKQGKTFLFAQERILAVETGIETSRTPTEAGFKITDVKWLLRNDIKPALTVEEKKYEIAEEQGRRFSRIVATIANDSSFDFEQMDIAVAVFDEEENLIGASRIGVERIRSLERHEVKILWPFELNGVPSMIRIEPRANVFKEGTVLKPQ